jgi:2OG-Fe(II) oxygenase superfamily
LLYLNPQWQQHHGGELCLMPFLGKPVTIAPIMDRLVIFRSDLVLHRVLPSQATRYALTIWLDAESDHVNQDVDVMLRIPKTALSSSGDWHALCKQLTASPMQRLLSRGVYKEEYMTSLIECMQNADGQDEMLAAHLSQLRAIEKNSALNELVERLRLTCADTTAGVEARQTDAV